MKNTFLDNPAVLERYLLQALAEYSDPEAQAAEQKWVTKTFPLLSDVQNVVGKMYTFPMPLTADNFKILLLSLGLK